MRYHYTDKFAQIVVRRTVCAAAEIENAMVGPHGGAGMVVLARWCGLPFENNIFVWSHNVARISGNDIEGNGYALDARAAVRAYGEIVLLFNGARPCAWCVD